MSDTADKVDLTSRLRQTWPTKKAEESEASAGEDFSAEAIADAIDEELPGVPWWRRLLHKLMFWKRGSAATAKKSREEKEPFRLERLAFWKRRADPDAMFEDILDESAVQKSRKGTIIVSTILVLAVWGGVGFLVLKPTPPAPKEEILAAAAIQPPSETELKVRERAIAASGGVAPTARMDDNPGRREAAEHLVDIETGPTGGLAPTAPVPELQIQTRGGMVPRIAADGRQPWQVYARPFNDRLNRPRIAIVVTDLGLIRAQTENALAELPRAVTLAVSPYAPNAREILAQAREDGFETLLQVPMEPTDYPTSDPGPRALYTSLTFTENEGRLDWIMARGAGYVGMIDSLGTRVLQSEELARRVLGRIQERGLLFVDTRSSAHSLGGKVARDIGLPALLNNRFIDIDAAQSAIEQKLDELERLARQTGASVGIASALPVTVRILKDWDKAARQRGVVLAPASAVVGRQRE